MASVRPRVYLDYNATRPMLQAARDAFVAALDLFGNPSSVHAEGRRARAAVEEARSSVAKLLGASSANVVFTAGATEAAITCLAPRWVRDGRDVAVEALAVADTDHPATRDGGRFTSDAVTCLPVDAHGVIHMRMLEAWLAGLGKRTGMLAICLANGETGVIQPIEAVRETIADHDVIFIVDAAQAAGRVPLGMDALGADAVVLSGHKIGAAKGVGAFVLRNERTRPFRLLSGGGQEHGMRSGTEAVPSIVSFGVAASSAAQRVSVGCSRIAGLRDRICDRLKHAGCEIVPLGEEAPRRLANTLAVVVPGLKAETAQIALDLEGFAVSAGSACSSGKVGASHVLAAMAAGGLAVEPAWGLLRISLGEETREAEVDAFVDAFAKIVRRAGNDLGRRQAA